VNGTAPDIQVVKPFTDAIELTKQILFRPFDLKKWLVVGFAAWLAHIGGGGFNYRTRYNRPADMRHSAGFEQLKDFIHNTEFWIIALFVICFVVFVLALILVFMWLRARGVFMFTDCIVRNRAAIKEPWREFRKIGNSFFIFSLLIFLIFFLLAALLAVPLIVLAIQSGRHNDLSVPVLVVVMLWACGVFLLAIAWALISQLMVPIMYRRRCLASEGFRAALSLITSYPGEITLYCLFWIVLAIGVVIVSCLAICLTCCVAALPYIGTVILLPIHVCLRSFNLLFLRQFGPDYDVWASVPAIETGLASTAAGGDVIPTPPPVPAPSEPPPPPPPVV